MTLTGRTTIVTGGGSGIGLAIARRLTADGAHVVLAGRSEARLEAALAAGAGHRAVSVDVRDPDSVTRLVAGSGEVSILVNAAGVIHAAPVHELSIDAFDEMIATNLRGAFLMCRAVVPGMRERGSGVIVNVGSVASRVSFPSMGGYAASKAALSALGGVIRAEGRGDGLRVIDVVAGATATSMWDSFWPDAPREHMMRPDEVADAVASAIAGYGGATIEELVIRPLAGDL